MEFSATYSIFCEYILWYKICLPETSSPSKMARAVGDICNLRHNIHHMKTNEYFTLGITEN